MRRVIGPHYMLVFLCGVGLGLLVSPTEAAEAASPERGNPAAHLFPGDHASEHWDLTARFDSGHVLVAEFLRPGQILFYFLYPSRSSCVLAS